MSQGIEDVTLPSATTSTIDSTDSSASSSSSRRGRYTRESRYSNLRDDVKESFVRIVKHTADPTLWRTMAENLKIKENKIRHIEKNYEENRNNESYSPYDELIQVYEDSDRSIMTLFTQLGRMNLLEAVTVLKDFVTEECRLSLSMEIPDFKLILDSEPRVVAAVPEVSYEDLEQGTDGWKEDRKLGQGGFGAVYLGTWINTKVAIKRIEFQLSGKNISKQDEKRLNVELTQSLNELRSLNQCRHDNIVQIYGYSSNVGKPQCLIYELMRGGTLKDKLVGSKPFPWNLRVRIMLETARGLQFLHEFKKEEGSIIHGDIKPANILLDEYGRAKIGDFGLARESRSKAGETISRIFGTQPYLPNDFVRTRRLSPKVDSYSFGIVLFEVATKKRVVDDKRTPSHLKNFIDLYEKGGVDIKNTMDTSEGNSEIEKNIFKKLLVVGLQCSLQDEAQRADMLAVYEALEKLDLAMLPSETQK